MIDEKAKIGIEVLVLVRTFCSADNKMNLEDLGRLVEG